jgi:hypothetical protein
MALIPQIRLHSVTGTDWQVEYRTLAVLPSALRK